MNGPKGQRSWLDFDDKRYYESCSWDFYFNFENLWKLQRCIVEASARCSWKLQHAATWKLQRFSALFQTSSSAATRCFKKASTLHCGSFIALLLGSFCATARCFKKTALQRTGAKKLQRSAPRKLQRCIVEASACCIVEASTCSFSEASALYYESFSDAPWKLLRFSALFQESFCATAWCFAKASAIQRAASGMLQRYSALPKESFCAIARCFSEASALHRESFNALQRLNTPSFPRSRCIPPAIRVQDVRKTVVPVVHECPAKPTLHVARLLFRPTPARPQTHDSLSISVFSYPISWGYVYFVRAPWLRLSVRCARRREPAPSNTTRIDGDRESWFKTDDDREGTWIELANREIRVNRGLGVDRGIGVDLGIGVDRGLGVNRGIGVDEGIAVNRGIGVDLGISTDLGITVQGPSARYLRHEDKRHTWKDL